MRDFAGLFTTTRDSGSPRTENDTLEDIINMYGTENREEVIVDIENQPHRLTVENNAVERKGA